ncbi:MAG: hypothetical protein ACFFCV_11540 [Promethearchaeota archaeon]
MKDLKDKIKKILRKSKEKRINHSISFKLNELYKEIEDNSKYREYLYFIGAIYNSIFRNISTCETIIILAFDYAYPDYFRETILEYKKKE